MTQIPTFDENELFDRLVEVGQMRGVMDREAYIDLVEEIIEEAREDGEAVDDEDLEGAEDRLEMRFDEYLARLSGDEEGSVG